VCLDCLLAFSYTETAQPSPVSIRMRVSAKHDGGITQWNEKEISFSQNNIHLNFPFVSFSFSVFFFYFANLYFETEREEEKVNALSWLVEKQQKKWNFFSLYIFCVRVSRWDWANEITRDST
jgi:hypothetical protein